MDASTSRDDDLVAAQALVQAELARSPPPASSSADPRIPPALDIQTLPTLSAQFDRLSTQEAQRDASADDRPRLDTTRFSLPAPAAGLDASEEEWKQAVDNAYVQLSHQEGRAINIDLMKKYGANHWRIHNYVLESSLSRYSAARSHITDSVSASTNRTRMLLQQDAEGKLSTLEAQWSQLVSTQLQMAVASLAAEHEVETLKQERQRLRQRIETLETA
ncbi:hypothetical protein OC846_002093 [Tilletia horrida]|uniref:Pre-mRNA-splicing factor SPF27 n=1 Tax=Tilletia horrida TaxID=155126 RepID=A0AAN6GUU5_9BASI|nr:hypothetical protein OC846_002093 [Tilletia horrida]KAK0568115.1 hypothetical protein OC861_002280 [Tilletia horrida]